MSKIKNLKSKIVNRMSRVALFGLLFTCSALFAAAEKADVSAYNIIWTAPSANSMESMPCGGGDIGLNVWVENGDILFYIARSGAFDENGELLKLGRVRLMLTPALAGANGFKQTLHLDKGCVSVSDASTEALIWVDVFRPVIHVEITGKQPVSVKAAYENWRYEDFVPHESQLFSTGLRKKHESFEIKTRKDVVEPSSDRIVFYHRNRSDVDNIFDVTVRMEWLDEVKNELYNPALNRTFGGYLQGDRLTFTGVTTGRYLNTDYKSYNMESSRPKPTGSKSGCIRIRRPTLRVGKADWKKCGKLPPLPPKQPGKRRWTGGNSSGTGAISLLKATKRTSTGR